MRLLITGFSGFVSKHFLDFLQEAEPGSVVLGIDKYAPGFPFTGYPGLDVSFRQGDLLDRESTEKILEEFHPEYILHLASVSSVALSWQTPLDSFVNNTNIFLNLVEQIRLKNKDCRILSVGSSEEFGEVSERELPLTEEHPLKPVSPYAVARVSQEMLSRVYADGYQLDIIMTRSFNHIGPGQRETFVISSFARQLVHLSRNPSQPQVITTGDLSVTRDFVDVRDVVRAYYLLLKEGRRSEVYNICSGKGIILKDILEMMSAVLQLQIRTETNPALIRPNENRKVIGSSEKIKNELGWRPLIGIRKSLEDIIAYWQARA